MESQDWLKSLKPQMVHFECSIWELGGPLCLGLFQELGLERILYPQSGGERYSRTQPKAKAYCISRTHCRVGQISTFVCQSHIISLG